VTVEHLDYLANCIEVEALKVCENKLVSETLRKIAKGLRTSARGGLIVVK